ncbi:NADH:ubiquinone reductase (H(+)-translocating) [Ranunculus cassubicifolius]
MAYGACYLKGTRIFDRGGMIAGPSPRSARWPMGIAAFGLCLPFLIKNSGSARESAGNNRKEGVHRVEWPRADLFGYIIQVESGVTGTAV